MIYSVLMPTDNLADPRVLYADGATPSGRMIGISHIIQWAAYGKRRNLFPQRPVKAEPTKPGFVYHDPKERPEAGEWR